jgi:hypothetical protein
MTESGKRLQVSSRPASQVEDRERRGALDVPQQRVDVLADVVVARAFPEILRALVVVLQPQVGDLLQLLRIQLRHRRSVTSRKRGTAR